MKLITRRILFCFCFILFLISSPLVILYAFGFRYDFTERKLIQTGIIYLTPNIQDNIKILINNKEESSKISIKGIFKKDFVLYNLIPKTYNIKIEKDNYHAWEKNLVVLPGIITYAQPLLLSSSPKTNLIFNDTNIPLWSVSDEFKKIFYLKNDNKKISANVYDFSKKTFNAKIIETSNIDSSDIPENSKIFLAPDGGKFGFVIPQKNTGIILLDSTEKNVSLIANFTQNEKVINGQWDDSSRYFLYLNDKGEINSYDTIAKISKKILENISGFSLKDGNIYYLDRNNLFFYRSSVNTPGEKQQLSYVSIPITIENKKLEKIKPMSVEKEIKILISAKNTLAAITPQKNLFAIPQNGIPVNLGNNIEAAMFSQDGENLLFNSPFEIFTNTLGDSQVNLITRLSQKISNVNWHNSYTHVWFLTNQTIKNIELDSRPTPNIIDFINMPEEAANILYTNTNYIYYDQLKDNNLSLYQVEI